MKKSFGGTLIAIVLVIAVAFAATTVMAGGGNGHGGNGNPGGPGSPTETGNSNGDQHGQPGNPGNNHASPQGCLHGEPDCKSPTQPPATQPPSTQPPATQPPADPNGKVSSTAVLCTLGEGPSYPVTDIGVEHSITINDQSFTVKVLKGDAASNKLTLSGWPCFDVQFEGGATGQWYTFVVKDSAGTTWVWQIKY